MMNPAPLRREGVLRVEPASFPALFQKMPPMLTRLTPRSTRLTASAALPVLAALAAPLLPASQAHACDSCGWGLHGDDVGGDTFQERVDHFNANLGPGGVPIDLKGGASGAANLGPGGTQNVWLDFSSSVGYSASMRNQVLDGMEDVFTGFDVAFSLTQPSGPVTRIAYDGGGLGGFAQEIDFRNLNQSVNAFVGTNFSATNTQRVNYGVNVGSHELGHTLGLRHHDSFGPIGTGTPPGTSIGTGYLPDFPGPANGDEFFFNIMSTPAFGGQPSIDNFLNSRAFLSERSLAKLAFADDGVVYTEDAGVNSTTLTAQVMDLEVLPVPAQRPAGTDNAGIDLPIRAASLIGSISAGADLDVYAIEAFAGDFLSVEAMSNSLTRTNDTVDTQLRVLDAAGVPLDYYGQPAFNDDESEDLDAHIFDLIIPSDGTYFIEVASFGTSTGDYELYAFTFGTVPEPTSLALLGLGGLAALRRRR